MTDYSIVLSGGSNNIDPNLSLGGDPSANLIRSITLNNLFSDVGITQSDRVDYRCIYFFNDSNNFFSVIEVYMESQVLGGSDVQVGVFLNHEKQVIIIDYLSSDLSGVANITNEFGNTFAWQWNDNGMILLQTLQDWFIFEYGVEMVPTVSTDGENVDIEWKDFRGHPLLIIESSFTNTIMSVSRLAQGSPINVIAPTISLSTLAPPNIQFRPSDADNPFVIGYLSQTEGFSLWLQRTTLANTATLFDDGFDLRFSYSL